MDKSKTDCWPKGMSCLRKSAAILGQANSFPEIVDRFGEPVYIYLFDTIANRCRELRNSLPPAVDIYYSLKANSNLFLVSMIRHHVQGAEVSSEGELTIALKAGFEPSRILLVGPAKSTRLLKMAVNAGIKAIVIESRNELDTLQQLSRDSPQQTAVFLRINPDFHASGTRLTMTGLSSQFGISSEESPFLIRDVLQSSSLRLAGLHVYLGTRILNSAQVAENTARILELCKGLERKTGFNCDWIDFGGGLGVDYFEEETPLDLRGLKTCFDAIIKDTSPPHAGKRYIMETGRFLTADSGIYATKVLSTKHSRGKRYVLTSGGTNHFFGSSYLSGIRKKSFPVAVLNKPDAGKFVKATVCGPLCTPTDIIASETLLPDDVAVGDIIGIFKTGAYGYSLGLLNFLSHFPPAEVMVQNDKVRLIRRPGDMESILKGQILPDIPRETTCRNPRDSLLQNTII